MAQNQSQKRLTYPASPRGDVVETLHGVQVADPYRWLEEIDSAETGAWIAAQNEVTFDYLTQLPERDKIRERITHLWDYEKFGVPFKRGGRYFYSYNNGLQNQSVLYWLESLEAEPRLLLDPNALSEDGTIALSGLAVSEDGKRLAYGLSASGSGWQTWRVREVDTGQDMADEVEWVKFSGASWTHDHQGFFYSRYDAPPEGLTYKGPNYYHKLYYHRLGTPQAEDVLVYERPDQKAWNFVGQVTEDGDYLIIWVRQGTHRQNAIFYQDLRSGLPGETVELLPNFDAHYAFIDNDGPLFYFTTDLDAPLSRVVAIDIRRPDAARWQEIIPERADSLQEVRRVNHRFIAFYLRHAQSRIEVFDQMGQSLGELPLPGIGSVAGFSGRGQSREIFYSFTSFTIPHTIYRHDLETNQTDLFRQPQVDIDPDAYVTEQIFYQSKDGAQVPMFLTYKKGLKRDGNNPTYLYGYGGFNISLTPGFSVGNLVWLERGGIYAQANLRGGAEYGRAWHEAGALRNKQNVFDDFIAAAEWLVANDYTSTPKLAIGGGSNGGLLVGACLTQRPDLFGACFAAVGVLDMLRFHKFTIGRAWTSDYGSPDDEEGFKTLLAYSPYHNLQPNIAYPPTLITTGDHDDRVFPAHSFKFAAALQSAQAGPAPTLIRIETKAGHGLGKPTGKLIAELADRLAFLLWHLKA